MFIKFFNMLFISFSHFFFFFFNDTATTEIYTLSLHERSSDLPIMLLDPFGRRGPREVMAFLGDRKSTRLNSSHSSISYAVFCLKKKKTRTHKSKKKATRTKLYLSAPRSLGM